MDILIAYLEESPLYEITTEDGPGATWCFMIIAKSLDGFFTHHKTFEHYEKVEAEKFVNDINAKREINLTHWEAGTAWDRYATPQTWDEEKADALFNEYQS